MADTEVLTGLPEDTPSQGLRGDSELMPSSRATAVTVSPEESTSAIASRLNSSVYRFVYLLPTWRYFLWNLKIPVVRCPRSRGSLKGPFLGALGGCRAHPRSVPQADRPVHADSAAADSHH
jgi:hypothetical protein